MHRTMFSLLMIILVSYSYSLPLEQTTTDLFLTNSTIDGTTSDINSTSTTITSMIKETTTTTTVNATVSNSSQIILPSSDRMNIVDHEEISSVDTFARLTGLLYETSTKSTKMSSSTPKSTANGSRNRLRITLTESNRFPSWSTTTTTTSRSKTTTQESYLSNFDQEHSLNDLNDSEQGSTLLLSLLAALLFCACFMASTIAILTNFHSIKRRSRITEMEAQLEKPSVFY